MAAKSAKLSEDTRILLNKARAKYLAKKPEIRMASDNVVIKNALKLFLLERK